MRVWGSAPPHLLNRKQLLGEHNELHVLLSGKWSNHPESLAKRFAGDISWLVMRHELVRIAMYARWGTKHSAANHLTPAPMHKSYEQGVHRVCHAYMELIANNDEPSVAAYTFLQAMQAIEFPPTSLEHDTPWDRDCMTVDQYVELGDDWSNPGYREGMRPLDDPYNIGWTAPPPDSVQSELAAKGITWCHSPWRHDRIGV